MAPPEPAAVAQDEAAEQRVTYLLQEIDANICAAHRSATQICATVRRHHHLLRQVHEAARAWQPLFSALAAAPPAARRSLAPARTPRRAPGFVDASGRSVASEATASASSGTQTFKTTTLQRHEDVDAGADASTSDARTDWSPGLGSPPRVAVLASGQASGPATPPSALSSVARIDSPGVSKNLMKEGAFEYSPPRQELEEGDSGASVSPPEFSTVKVAPPSVGPRWRTAPQSPARPSAAATASPGSGRKRKRASSPVFPKTHHPSPSPAGKHASMRRKYGAADYSTPTRKRGRPAPQSHAQDQVESQPQDLGSAADDDEPLTPDLDMASPLLHTRLKAMTPNTPLSNRLVGASLDVGSVSQEARLLEYDDSITSGEAAPTFSLSILPVGFQTGAGAVQIATLYSKFQADGDAMNPALSVGQLEELLPQLSRRKIEVLVDTLVSRRLLRPFAVEGTMFWQIPS